MLIIYRLIEAYSPGFYTKRLSYDLNNDLGISSGTISIIEFG